MVCEPEVYASQPGVLDFQDPVYGASPTIWCRLLRDAYVEWEEERVTGRSSTGRKRARRVCRWRVAGFYRDFEWMGAQRHIKVLGIFARLYHRDGKDRYLRDMPLVMRYLRSACARYAELAPMLRLLEVQARPSGLHV